MAEQEFKQHPYEYIIKEVYEQKKKKISYEFLKGVKIFL